MAPAWESWLIELLDCNCPLSNVLSNKSKTVDTEEAEM